MRVLVLTQVTASTLRDVAADLPLEIEVVDAADAASALTARRAVVVLADGELLPGAVDVAWCLPMHDTPAHLVPGRLAQAEQARRRALVDAELAALREPYREEQRQMFRALSERWDADDEDVLPELARAAHRLRGTAGGFGFGALGIAGARLEESVREGSSTVREALDQVLELLAPD